MKGEQPVFSGGRAITGWRKGEGKLWVADVPGGRRPGKWYFQQLFVNGQRRVRARTPNEGYCNDRRPASARARQDRNSDPDTELGFSSADSDLQGWAELGAMPTSSSTTPGPPRAALDQGVDEQEKTSASPPPAAGPIGAWDREPALLRRELRGRAGHARASGT